MTLIALSPPRHQAVTRAFLTARWQNLIMLTYAVPPAVLTPLLPPQCELETIDGDAFVSLVAFDFADTRVAGIAWPGHISFPEINLRFYVRHGEQHGVCFIRELISKPIVAAVAWLFYNEPYQLAPLRSRVTRQGDLLQVEHCLQIRRRRFRIQVAADPIARLTNEWEPEHFFKEQRWGFGTSRGGKLLRYHVQHAPWRIHPIQEIQMDWDWQAIYGPRWAFLQNQPPCCSMLVAGSAVRLSPGIGVGAEPPIEDQSTQEAVSPFSKPWQED